MPISSYMLKTSICFILDGHSDEKPISNALAYCFEMPEESEVQKEPTSHIQYNPHPKWITEAEIDLHAEEARVIAIQIFRFIRFLAADGYKVVSYWREPKVSRNHKVWHRGVAEYAQEICDQILSRLRKETFYISECD